jgi:hypothetical protein
LPFNAGALLQDGEDDVDLHAIFQSGINFAGVGGGGIPIPVQYMQEAKDSIFDYSAENAKAALAAALYNGSQVLVYNIGIGAGFFAGNYKNRVKEANINAVCQAAALMKDSQSQQVEVVVPNIGYSELQKNNCTRRAFRLSAEIKTLLQPSAHAGD